jgi:S1-C subfamily serine protease
MMPAHFMHDQHRPVLMSLTYEEHIMSSSGIWTASVIVGAALASNLGPVCAQDRTPPTRDDAVLSVDGVVREVFQSVRRDRVDYIVQIEVTRSEALRAPRTPVRVLVPAPGDTVYVHTSQRANIAQGLGQTGRGQPQATGLGARPIPVERAQVRAYVYPRANGGWEGAGSDCFELTTKMLAESSPADPPPAVETAPGSAGGRPMPNPSESRNVRSALTTLGLTGEPQTEEGRFVVRVSSVEPGGAGQRAGLEPGDIIIGVNDKVLTAIEQLEELTQHGGRLNLVVLDVNNGRTARVPVELPIAGRRSPGGLPPVAERQDAPASPRDAPASGPRSSGRSLGVSAEPVTIGQRTGMKVVGVQPGSPAQKAGIERGDVIVAANGVPITGAESMSAVIHKSGATLNLTVRDTRNGKDTRVDVKLGGDEPEVGNVTAAPADAANPTSSGRRLGAVTELFFYDVDPAAKVTEVEPGSPAARAGIEPGDVIVEANGTPVLHPKNLDDIVRKSGSTLKLMIVDPRTQKKTPVGVTLGADR